MLSNVKNGWCEFDLLGFHGTPSYLTDPVIDIGEALLKDGPCIIEFDEEDTDFLFVFDTIFPYVIANRESSKLYCGYTFDITKEYVAREFVKDIERDFVAWLKWEEEDYPKGRETYIRNMLQEIREKYNIGE